MNKSSPISVTLGDREKWLWKWIKGRKYAFDSNDRRNTFLYIYYLTVKAAYGRSFADYILEKRNDYFDKPLDKLELENKTRVWSLPKNNRNFTNEKIIELLGITDDEITELKIGHNKNEQAERKKRVLEKQERNTNIYIMRAKGMTQSQIASELHISVSTVKRVLRAGKNFLKGSDFTITETTTVKNAKQEFVSSEAKRLYSLYKKEKQNAPDDEYEQALSKLTETKDNILIQGSGGTGKTTLIKKFLSHLSQEEYNKTLLVAPTGKAADLIGGTTIHKAFEMNNCVQIPDKVRVLPKMLRNIKTLIIDELSMVRCDIFDRIIQTLQFAKSQGQSIRLIALGDFGQLKPVATFSDKQILKSFYPNLKGYYAFNSEKWAEANFKKIILHKVKRQKDTELIEHLEGIKYGRLDDLEWFINNAPPFAPAKPIYICSTRKCVDEFNNTALSDFEDLHTYNAAYEGLLPSELPCPEIIKLAVGVRVMTISNSKNYKNGNIGTVKALSEDRVIVKLDNGKTVTVRQKTFELDNGTKYRQFPLIIAYAITVHKPQGSTFNNVVMVCDSFFESGMLYTALSRCTAIDNLMFLGRLQEQDLKIDIEALKMTVYGN